MKRIAVLGAFLLTGCNHPVVQTHIKDMSAIELQNLSDADLCFDEYVSRTTRAISSRSLQFNDEWRRRGLKCTLLSNGVILRPSWNPHGGADWQIEHVQEIAKAREQLDASLAKAQSSPATPSQPPQIAAVPPPPPSTVNATEERISTGTGYAINSDGYVLTNYHVIGECGHLKVRRGPQATDAELIASDATNDLAVIKGSLPNLQPVHFRQSTHGAKDIRAADTVVVLGFPYAGLLATTPQTTTGTVTALAGIKDDSRFLQISAPIQPGNSGGPLFDRSGNVVGAVVAFLDPIVMAKETGSIPQNINFAIKTGIIREFLDGKGISYQSAPSTTKMDPADVSEAGAKSVVLVECTK